MVFTAKVGLDAVPFRSRCIWTNRGAQTNPCHRSANHLLWFGVPSAPACRMTDDQLEHYTPFCQDHIDPGPSVRPGPMEDDFPPPLPTRGCQVAWDRQTPGCTCTCRSAWRTATGPTVRSIRGPLRSVDAHAITGDWWPCGVWSTRYQQVLFIHRSIPLHVWHVYLHRPLNIFKTTPMCR